MAEQIRGSVAQGGNPGRCPKCGCQNLTSGGARDGSLECVECGHRFFIDVGLVPGRDGQGDEGE